MFFGQVVMVMARPARTVVKAIQTDALEKAGAEPMAKGCPADALAIGCERQKSDCRRVVEKLAEVATAQVKGAGKFVVPGLCMIKTRLKPATKAGKREVFGKVVMVKARPARTVVKAFPAAALKKQF